MIPFTRDIILHENTKKSKKSKSLMTPPPNIVYWWIPGSQDIAMLIEYEAKIGTRLSSVIKNANTIEKSQFELFSTLIKAKNDPFDMLQI